MNNDIYKYKETVITREEERKDNDKQQKTVRYNIP